MMEDQVDNQYIEDELSQKNIIVLHDDSSCEEEYIICSQVINNKSIQLRCELTEFFPYEFPKIYILESCISNIKGIPHINRDNSICLFDDETNIPDFRTPNDLVVTSITKAFSIVSDGLNGKNFSDFDDECLAYWKTSKSLEESIYYSAFHNDDSPKMLYCLLKNNDFYFCQNNDYKKYLSNLNIANEYCIDKKCIYIPITSDSYPKIITYRDAVEYIKAYSKYYKFYKRFIETSKYKTNIIILGLEMNGSYALCGFYQKSFKDINGFRKGKSPIELAVKGVYGNTAIERFSVHNISQDRLFSRGGIENYFFDKEVAIIGCGSLGSHLAEGFASVGVSKYKLFDNQILTEENIGRHYCGFNQVCKRKTEALEQELINHNPNIIVKTFSDNIHSYLNKSVDVFNNCNYIFITIGRAPIEYRFVQYFNNHNINVPIIMLWVEPYALCGHALILNKPQDIYSEFFDVNLEFKDSVILNASELYKRESGCQSTYVPYSGLDIKIFVNSFIQRLVSKRFDSDKNYHYIWFGNMSKCKEFNAVIDERWKNFDNGSEYIERID